MDLLTDINWIGIVVVVLLSFALGFLWYGPLFGKAWMTELGKSEEDLQGGVTPFILNVVYTLIMAFVMEVLISCLGVKTWTEGALLGLAVGVGLVSMSYLGDAAFSGKSTKLTLIEAGYRSVYILLIGIILGLWAG